ncbi:MAG: hypothetical protein MHPDNHAH_02337 [Anaerolineales bacterium]|nr:hypothetical protein [Anaerolineales bacterium]
MLVPEIERVSFVEIVIAVMFLLYNAVLQPRRETL